MTKRPTIETPLEWKLWKNRQRRDAIVVSLSTFEGRNLFAIRLHTTSQDGKMLPTSKGVSVMIGRLPELAQAVNRALKKAQALELLDGAAEDDATSEPGVDA
jgi:hypothetical protein